MENVAMSKKTGKSTDRTEEAIDWLETAGTDLLDAGAAPEDIVAMAMDVVSQAFPGATFRELDLQATAGGLL
jgi:hypothetical protein